MNILSKIKKDLTNESGFNIEHEVKKVKNGRHAIIDNSHFYFKKWNFKNWLISNELRKNYFSIVVLNISPLLIWKSGKVVFYVLMLILFGLRKRVSKQLISVDKVSISSLDILSWFSANKEAEKLFEKISSKSDLLQLKYRNVIIGDLVYDSYLKDYRKATVDIGDIRLKKIIKKAIYIYKQCEKNKYLNDKSNLVYLSHSVYSVFGVISRYTIDRSLSVYAIQNTRGYFTKKLTKEHPYQTPDFSIYRSSIKNIEKNNLDEILKISEKKLEERVNGNIDSSIVYMKESAYSASIIALDFTTHFDNRPHVVIMTHCFFDSPHIYDGMIFPDFYEWLRWTIEFCYKNRINVVLKPHPNGLAGNEKIIKDLSVEFPWIDVIKTKISNKSIALTESVACVLTVYGTIAHEMAFLGMPVICSGSNPHQDFNFTITCSDIEEYGKEILGLVESNYLKDFLKTEEAKKEVCHFYYAHYLANDSQRCKRFNTEIEVLPNKRTSYNQIFNAISDMNTISFEVTKAMKVD